MQANRIARDLGIETKGKRLAQVVAEIDAADVRTMMSNQDAATTTASATRNSPTPSRRSPGSSSRAERPIRRTTAPTRSARPWPRTRDPSTCASRDTSSR